MWINSVWTEVIQSCQLIISLTFRLLRCDSPRGGHNLTLMEVCLAKTQPNETRMVWNSSDLQDKTWYFSSDRLLVWKLEFSLDSDPYFHSHLILCREYSGLFRVGLPRSKKKSAIMKWKTLYLLIEIQNTTALSVMSRLPRASSSSGECLISTRTKKVSPCLSPVTLVQIRCSRDIFQWLQSDSQDMRAPSTAEWVSN